MREIAELFLREATARPDCLETLIAHRSFGITCFYFGDFAGAHQHFQKTVELYDQARLADFANRFGEDPRAAAEILDALILWALGRIDEALRLAERALGNALIWAKGYSAPETSAAFARARELASREEDASERFSAYYGLWGDI